MLKLWLLSQSVNTRYGACESAIVTAHSPEEAIRISPLTGRPMTEAAWAQEYSVWVNSPVDISIRYIGIAAYDLPSDFVLASFIGD